MKNFKEGDMVVCNYKNKPVLCEYACSVNEGIHKAQPISDIGKHCVHLWFDEQIHSLEEARNMFNPDTKLLTSTWGE